MRLANIPAVLRADSKTLFGFFLILLVFGTGANSTEDCMECHDDPDMTMEKGDKEVSIGIEEEKFADSVHADEGCTGCHADLSKVELPHEEMTVAPVDCSRCHQDAASVYAKSLHGQAVAKGAKLAPKCSDCHGAHEIVPVDSAGSKVAKFNIPFVCGRCHKEGTEVSRTYDIPQEKILTHYSQSIHGEGLFKQGLTVTAVCTDCHNSHNILPHTDPKSSIFKGNVAGTCQKCHGLIEQVHQKVIRGELWEKEPDNVPVCIDCHSPHKARKVFYELGMSDRDCMECHGKTDLTGTRDGKTVSMFVDAEKTKNSTHAKVACAQCHVGVSPLEKRPCAPISARVDCSICHAEEVETHAGSTHGKLADRGDKNAPTCLNCHGTHDTKAHKDPASSTYPTNVPDLCGNCHRKGNTAAAYPDLVGRQIVQQYEMSIHGKGLLKSGLVVTAMCTDCHTAHNERPASDPASSIHRDNIAKTCAECHHGIYEQFTKSIHFTGEAKDNQKLPRCNDCHSSHTISRTDKDVFKLEIISQCGQCHQDVTESYFETFHGKVSKLGYSAAAKCYDCHGAHDILPNWNPESRLSRDNIVDTCGKCHPGSHRRFAGYLTHATHHDREKYPVLYYTFWFMSFLLIGVFAFFGFHTLMWLPRSLKERKRRKELHLASGGKHVQRFSRLERRLHVLVVVSFLGLALTGMTLKFSYLGWAQWVSKILGGFESAGFIHRICALITFFYFGAHLVDLVRKKRRDKTTWRKFLFGPGSMMPTREDLRQFAATFKWFLGMGPKPAYGRWTYWEKFDYLAVFWGVAIIGFTGLVLWFPEFFTRFLPGWSINVATIVHSDEALLAAGFIFTVHFFNTHFRPEKFPMDTVIFTGRVPLEEFKEERPLEYQEMVEKGNLDKHLVDPLAPAAVRALRIFGSIALGVGLVLVVLIIWAEVFGYR
jgi:cytochrome b subunit of formate dehydrogenase